jgi:hypothetical protein
LDFKERAYFARMISLERYLPEKYQNLTKSSRVKNSVNSFKLEKSPQEVTPTVAFEHDMSPEAKPS